MFDRADPDGSATQTVVVQLAEGDRLVGADGVKSAVRASLELQDPTFCAKVSPWKCEFRVLFAPPGAASDSLDPNVHYIISGCYAATVQSADGRPRWCFVMGARDDYSPATRQLLLSHR